MGLLKRRTNLVFHFTDYTEQKQKHAMKYKINVKPFPVIIHKMPFLIKNRPFDRLQL